MVLQERCTRAFREFLLLGLMRFVRLRLFCLSLGYIAVGVGVVGVVGGGAGCPCMCWKEGKLKGWVVWVRVG